MNAKEFIELLKSDPAIEEDPGLAVLNTFFEHYDQRDSVWILEKNKVLQEILEALDLEYKVYPSGSRVWSIDVGTRHLRTKDLPGGLPFTLHMAIFGSMEETQEAIDKFGIHYGVPAQITITVAGRDFVVLYHNGLPYLL